jgi:glutamyl-tRNA synthetase
MIPDGGTEFHMSKIHVRFAPSPTGNLHIGGARTALFNWLFARANDGLFLLRIEDTDRERSTDEYLRSILDSLAWLGLDWDGDPVYQRTRQERHVEAARRLLDGGKAYRCFCTAEDLRRTREEARKEKGRVGYDGRCRRLEPPFPDRPSAVRFRAPDDGETVVEDLIQGRVAFRNSEIDDLIILRSDGTPTYNLAVVVDDADMGITHVIRGDDHLDNTAKQTLLYRALDLPVPRFAHVPMILGADKTRLSKRHGATSVTAYREEGFLPEALVNYLVRLGWSHGDQEIFTRDEMVRHFDLAGVGKAASVFNPEKLRWLNAHYLKTLPPEKIAELLAPRLRTRGFPAEPGPWLARVVETLVERAQTLEEMAEGAAIYFLREVTYDPKAEAKFLTPEILEPFRDLVRALEELPEFRAADIESAFRGILDARGLKLKHLAQPVRVAITGGTVSPGIFDVLELIGRDEVLERLEAAVRHVSAG